jgi:hypothetical protein
MILWARRMSFLCECYLGDRRAFKGGRCYHSVSAFGSSIGTFTGASILEMCLNSVPNVLPGEKVGGTRSSWTMIFALFAINSHTLGDQAVGVWLDRTTLGRTPRLAVIERKDTTSTYCSPRSHGLSGPDIGLRYNSPSSFTI